MKFFKFLHDIIINICGCARQSRKAGFNIGFGLAQDKQKTIPMPAETTIKNTQKITATLKPVTDSVPPKPAKLDGPPRWEVVSGNATVSPADDGLSAELISSDDPGDTVFLVRADANLGEGVEELSDTITLHVEGESAKNLGLTFGAPVPK